jgi:hypothetical protein
MTFGMAPDVLGGDPTKRVPENLLFDGGFSDGRILPLRCGSERRTRGFSGLAEREPREGAERQLLGDALDAEATNKRLSSRGLDHKVEAGQGAVRDLAPFGRGFGCLDSPLCEGGRHGSRSTSG